MSVKMEATDTDYGGPAWKASIGRWQGGGAAQHCMWMLLPTTTTTNTTKYCGCCLLLNSTKYYTGSLEATQKMVPVDGHQSVVTLMSEQPARPSHASAPPAF